MPYEILLQHVSIVPCLCVFGISHFGLYYLYSSTIKLNAIDGGVSQIAKVSSGSVLGTNPKITQVKVYLNVASGTDPFDLYIESPEGTVARLTPSTKSRTYYVTDFVCENPKGDWYLQIENLGKTYDPNKLYPASTVTATITVTYSY